MKLILQPPPDDYCTVIEPFMKPMDSLYAAIVRTNDSLSFFFVSQYIGFSTMNLYYRYEKTRRKSKYM